jgi:hypothetical protein
LYFFLAFWWYVFKTMMARRRTLTDPEAAQLNAVFAATGGAFAVVFVAGNFVDFVKAEIMIWLLATLACLVEIARKQATVTSAAPTPAAAKARVGPRYATPRQQQSAKFRN